MLTPFYLGYLIRNINPFRHRSPEWAEYYYGWQAALEG